MSLLVPKTLNVKNNIKSSMITRLFSDLDQCDCVEPVREEVVIKFDEIDRTQNFLGENVGKLPCINVDCEFLKYLKIFHRGSDFFLLPAYSENYHCIVCDMISKGCLVRSEIVLMNNHQIRLSKIH
jgi:hypothetical protein